MRGGENAEGGAAAHGSAAVCEQCLALQRASNRLRATARSGAFRPVPRKLDQRLARFSCIDTRRHGGAGLACARRPAAFSMLAATRLALHGRIMDAARARRGVATLRKAAAQAAPVRLHDVSKPAQKRPRRLRQSSASGRAVSRVPANAEKVPKRRGRLKFHPSVHAAAAATPGSGSHGNTPTGQ